jgi:KipI family sensor histidine kinase inhibitor
MECCADGPRFLPVGDTGLSIEFSERIDPIANDAVAALDHAIATAEIPGLVETVPSFRSLLVQYEPAVIALSALQHRIAELLGTRSSLAIPPRRRWHIPVAYEAPFGEDLAEAAALLGRTEREIVATHTAADFRVYMLGFQPGLPNLGGLPRELHLSRRTVPRPPVPSGSVTIGGVQGAIMPMASPIGFYLLGRTPVRPFDRRRENPALFRPGDTIRFYEIGSAEYARIDAAATAGDLYAGADVDAA